MTNPAIRIEAGHASADRLVDLALSHPMPDNISKTESGLYLVDLPPDLKVIIEIAPTPDPHRPSRPYHTLYFYRNEDDRDQGLADLEARRGR